MVAVDSKLFVATKAIIVVHQTFFKRAERFSWLTLKHAFLFVAALFFAVTSVFAAETTKPPNIVLILIDDLGWADLPCYGNQFHETPAIDRLAATGQRFTDFYAAAPVCSPARASLMSGQYPARLGLTDFVPGHWRPFEQVIVPPIIDHLPLEVQSLAEVLKPAGYTSGYFGKWHLGSKKQHHPLRQGFDEAIVTAGRHRAPHFRTFPATAVEEGTFLVEFLTDRTVEFIEKNQERPFFAMLSHYAVHIPLESREDLVKKYTHKEKSGTGPCHPVYAGMIEQVDQSVARVMAKLDELGLTENTLVLFTSDNGGLHKVFTAVGEEVTSNAPLRDEKGTLYEGGIRVPLIAQWPGKIEPGAVCAEPCSTIDILPTLASMANSPVAPEVDGKSLAPLFSNSKALLDREAVYFHYPHYHHGRPASVIRRRDWKLLENLDDGSKELYHLAEDVGETKNLANKMSEKVAELGAQLATWRKSVGAKMPTKNPNYNPGRAGEWWSRHSEKPLNLERMDRFYRTRKSSVVPQPLENKEGASEISAPNVVLIISDDQAWSDYGFMGHPHIETPRLVQLARESLVFPRGYVPSSLCCPSLASMITGLYPHQHRIVGNDPKPPRQMSFAERQRDPNYQALCKTMDDNIERVATLPRLLGEKGYLSHQSGKWWLGSYRRGGFTHGMTHGDPARGGRHGDEGLKIGREGLGPIDRFISHAQAEKKPFFLWYAPFLPHRPHNPPERLLKKYREKTDSIHIAKYWAMCEWFDETCGQLLDLLVTHGVSDNTMVLYVCDNGWINLRDKSGYAPRSKRSPYDGGLRTPIMIRWPGHVAPQRSERLASSLDLAPTILAACGLAPTKDMHGINLLDPQAVAARERIFGEVYAHDIADLEHPAASLKYRWCIEGGWKLIVPHLANVPKGKMELYNLIDDPEEKNNLADKEQAIVVRLLLKLDSNLSVPEAAIISEK